MHTLEVDLANTRTENQTLRRYVKALEQRLGEQLGTRDAAGRDPAERIDHLVNENDQLSSGIVTDDALHRVETACAELTERGQPVTFPAVADHANLARATLYRRPELRAIIEDARARARNANTLTGLATEIQQLRTSPSRLRQSPPTRRITTPPPNQPATILTQQSFTPRLAG